MGVGRLVLRVIVGLLMVGHGTQKLLGWFRGHGLEGTADFFESIGLRPGRRNALVAGAAETAGGAALALGLGTPLAAASLAAVQITATRTVHWDKGLWATEGGYEYNAVLLAALFMLVEGGPGPLSMDRSLGWELRGTPWAVASMLAGAAGAAGAMWIAGGQPPAEGEPGEELAGGQVFPV